MYMKLKDHGLYFTKRKNILKLAYSLYHLIYLSVCTYVNIYIYNIIFNNK